MKKVKLHILHFLFTIVAFNFTNAQQEPPNLTYLRETLLDKSFPGFHLTDLEGKKWDKENTMEKIVVVNFWFTSCKPCILEMPHLNELVKQNKDNPVVFIAPAPEDEKQIRRFLKKFTFDYTIVPSSLDFIDKLKVENFPTHLIIDKEGIIRQVFIGYADDIKEKLQTAIDKLIK